MCFIDFPMHAFPARENQKCTLDIRNNGPLQCISKADLCEGEIDRFILKIEKVSDCYAHHNGRAPCWRINLSHHFSVQPQIQCQSANAGMTAVIFPLSHCGGASSPRRCTVSEIRSRSAGANHPCMAHNTHTHTHRMGTHTSNV